MSQQPFRNGATAVTRPVPPPPTETLEVGAYRVRFARDLQDADEALRLRFRVFNVELGEGLALYVAASDKRYLFGCCSLTGTEPEPGLRVQRYLEENGCLHPELRVHPRPALSCPSIEPRPPAARFRDVPKLFRTYLRNGAQVCGPPAIDRQFNTTDFLVLFDVEKMDRTLFRLYF